MKNQLFGELFFKVSTGKSVFASAKAQAPADTVCNHPPLTVCVKASPRLAKASRRQSRSYRLRFSKKGMDTQKSNY